MQDCNQMSALHRLFCYALADAPECHGRALRELWKEVGDDAIWEFAGEHESQGTVFIALERALGPATPVRWREAHARVSRRIQVYMRQMDLAATALAAEGIPLVALKNAGIARGIFSDLGGCVMGDVDLLVRPIDMAAAHEVFVRLGFRLLGNQEVGREALGKRMTSGTQSSGVGDVTADILAGGREYAFDLTADEPLWFELQCRTVGGKWIAADMEPHPDGFVSRSIAIPGTAVRLLAPEDNLLQVCLHTAKHTYVRAPGFRLHTDVDRIVRRCTINWDGFVSEVKRLGVCTAVYLSLLIPANMLHTPVPDSVLRSLKPIRLKERALLWSLGNVGYFHPRTRKWGKAGYIFFNLMLYDNLGGVWRAIFPDRETMRRKHGATSRWNLPLRHMTRIAGLLVRKLKT